MTDGERLVWATTYALALDRGSGALAAVHVAAIAVMQLREAAEQRLAADGNEHEKSFLDEMVNIP